MHLRISHLVRNSVVIGFEAASNLFGVSFVSFLTIAFASQETKFTWTMAKIGSIAGTFIKLPMFHQYTRRITE
jgi:hypothetical protein